jgi:hypothetical protein
MKKLLATLLVMLAIFGAISCKSTTKAQPGTISVDLLSATRSYNSYLEATIKAIDSQPDDRHKHDYVESLKPVISVEVSKWKDQADRELRAGTYINTTSTQEYKDALEKMKTLAPQLVSRLTKYSR